MRTIRKRVLAVCMAVMLLVPGFAVLAEEMPEENDVSDGEILQTVSGSDIQTEADSDADLETEDLAGQIMLLAEQPQEITLSTAEQSFFNRMGSSAELTLLPESIPYRVSPYGEDWMAGVTLFCDVNNNPTYVYINGDVETSTIYNVYTTYDVYLQWVDGYKEWILENDYDYNPYYVIRVMGYEYGVYYGDGTYEYINYPYEGNWRFEETEDASTEGTFGINGGLRWEWNAATKCITISGDDTPNVTITSYGGDDGTDITWKNNIFNENVETIRFVNCTLRNDLSDFFAGLKHLKSIDVSGLTMVNIQSTLRMFGMCNSLTGIDLSGLDTSNVWIMEFMFTDCSSLTDVDVSHFNTSQVTNMLGMFAGCSQLSALDVSNFDTGNVTNMFKMFCDCRNLSSLDISHFDTGKVTNLIGMFENCSSLTNLDMSNFDVGNATRMGGTVYGCSNLTTLCSPINVGVSDLLPTVPGTFWTLPDGTEVTELPQGLDYSVTLTRSGTPTTPQITTTTPDLNMEDVVRVKYVPYSYTVETNNTDPDNAVTFSLKEGRLADGLELYPGTGEIYGVPLETGSFPITVKATYSNPTYLPSYAELTLTVLDNTDANVGVATDAGYDITQPVVSFAMENAAGSGAQTLVSQGEYSQFRDVYIDGRKLTAGQDYTSEAGSTRITILNQTLSEGGEGTHTLGIEFRTEEGVLKRAAQNYVVSKGSGSGDNSGDDAGDNTGNNTGNSAGNNSGSSTSSTSDSNNSVSISSTVTAPAETVWQDFIIYTVEKGDSLWKIAVKFYGQGSSWRRIYEDNKLVIKNPNRLYKGQQLIIRLTAAAKLPNVPQKTDPVPGDEALSYAPNDTLSIATSDAREGNLYRIQQGDRLWTIAHRAYGSGKLWPLIYEANRDVIADPERIRIGQVIKIPQREYAAN